ncbi:MAG: serine protease, partial [Chloroflexi bacterium]|nr:serine protease [Chloroflexota bacterium]
TPQPTATPPPTATRLPPTPTPMPPWDVALSQVRPSVVRINWTDASGGRSLGSGAYIGEGYILTAHHVVEGASTVTVTANIGALTGTATVVGWDAAKDIAVLRVVGTWSLPALQLRATNRGESGQEVALLGYPLFNDDSPSISRGVISRYLRLWGWVIETDAATNSGNSGGPLVDRNGKIVGVLQATRQGREEGLAVALTSDEVLTILAALKSGSKT